MESLFANPNDAKDMAVFVWVIATPLCMAFRFWRYRAGHAPPMSLWGRFWTGRWIIPGYDQIYVGPVCAGIGSVFAYRFMNAQRWPPEITCPTCLALMLFVILTAPPSLARWRLTGRHRLAPSLSYQQDSANYVRVG